MNAKGKIRSWISKIRSWIRSVPLAILMVGTILFIGDALIRFWYKYIGLPIFGAVVSNGFYDFLAVAIFIAFTIYSFTNAHRISNRIWILIGVYAIVYAELRFSVGTQNYCLIPFHNHYLKDFYYADIIPFAMLIYIASSFCRAKNQPLQDEKSETLYFEDITKVKDLLGHRSIAKTMAKVIRNDYFNRENAVGIAITGEWGSGKSTFLGYLEDSLNDCVKVKFDPWTENSTDVATDLLLRIEEGVKKEDGHAARLLRRYMDKLNVTNVTGWFSLCLLALKNFFDSDSKDEHRERLRSALKKLDDPVVVFIDDSDRLPGDQFLKTISMIRGIANLPNVVFIVAYDQERANEKLKDYGGEDFMRKLFNVIHPLQPINEEIIRKEICHNIAFIVSGKEEDPGLFATVEEVFKKEVFKQLEIKRYLPTFREMKRFCNLIGKDYSLIKEAATLYYIDLRQWVLLELLKYSDIATYTLLTTDPEYYLKKEEPFSLISPYYVKMSNVKLSNTESEHLLNILFPANIGINDDTYQISNPVYFKLYSNLELPEKFLPPDTKEKYLIHPDDSEDLATQKAESIKTFIRENWVNAHESNIESVVCEILKSYTGKRLFPILETIVEEFSKRKSVKTLIEIFGKDDYRKYSKIVRDHIYISALSFMAMEDFCSYTDHEAESDTCILQTNHPLILCAIFNQHIKNWENDVRIASDVYLFELLNRLVNEGKHREVIWVVADCISRYLPNKFLAEYTASHFHDYLPYLLWWRQEPQTGEKQISADINAIESLFLSHKEFKLSMDNFIWGNIANAKLIQEFIHLVDLGQLKNPSTKLFRIDQFPLLSKYLLEDHIVVSDHFLESETFWTEGNRLEGNSQFEFV